MRSARKATPKKKRAPLPPAVSAEAWLAAQLRKPGVRAAVAKRLKEMEAEQRAYALLEQGRTQAQVVARLRVSARLVARMARELAREQAKRRKR
jgi:hypothetical protein